MMTVKLKGCESCVPILTNGMGHYWIDMNVAVKSLSDAIVKVGVLEIVRYRTPDALIRLICMMSSAVAFSICSHRRTVRRLSLTFWM